MTWEDWAEQHKQTFAWDRPELLQTLVRWARLFQGAGFAPREMADASEWVALHDPPRYPDGHLRSLLDRARAARAAHARPTAEDWAECPDCGSTGVVSVPSWNHVARRWYTAGVACTCNAGVRHAESMRGYWASKGVQREVVTLDVFEASMPDWRERLKANSRQQAEELHAVNEAGGLAASVGRVVSRAGRARKAAADAARPSSN